MHPTEDQIELRNEIRQERLDRYNKLWSIKEQVNSLILEDLKKSDYNSAAKLTELCKDLHGCIPSLSIKPSEYM